MKTVHKVSAWTLVVLGTGHTLLTPIFSPGFDTDALWFAGSGLGLLFLGLLNLTVLMSAARATLNLCLIANLMGFVYTTLVAVTLPVPQAFLAILASLGVMIGCISARKSILAEIR